jgi:hypothetical protein
MSLVNRSSSSAKERSSTTLPLSAHDLEKACSLSDEEQARIPQPDEREYLVEWDDDDPLNPRNLPTARKWLIVLIVSIGSLLV